MPSHVFISLILGHLIADFPLQTSSIFQWKMRSIRGVAFHSGVHLATNLFLFHPFAVQVWPALLVLFFLHILQDQAKDRLGGENVNTPLPFLLDQLLHVAILAAAAALPPLSQLPEAFLPPRPSLVLAGAITATFAGTVLTYTLAAGSSAASRPEGIPARRQLLDVAVNGLLFGSVVSRRYEWTALALAIKGVLWLLHAYGQRYPAALDLGFNPVWSILTGLTIRQAAGL